MMSSVPNLHIRRNLNISGRKEDITKRNIGTQSVQEIFFCDRSIRRTVCSNDLLSFFGCDVQQERNWEFIM